ncbi:uncharacterized protein LOC124266129, partial [Haliotis rubra]|uniref:uncharacterized protein LOC124266129 n=1 Tax=Haliotis rubra TaxID=36100 RepID=UPI001EE52821
MVTPTNVPVLVSDGDQVNFTCVALGNAGMPFQYHWSIGTRTVSTQSSTLLTVGRHVFINDSLTCTLISSNDSTLGSSTANIRVQYREKPVELSLADTSSSSCSPIRQTYIVGGSLGLIVLALMGLVLLMLVRQHNLSAEKKSTEGDMVEDCTNQYYLHCVPRDQKNLSLSTCDNSCSRISSRE